MRHRKANRRLGQKETHRIATIKSLATALLVKESIKTTKVKAKEAQSFIDNLITIAKNNNPESKRRVFALIRDKKLIGLLFNEIAPRFKARNGGYTRLISVYPRRGDGSPMAILELAEKKPKAPVKKKEKVEKQKVREELKKDQRSKEEPTKAAPPGEEKKEHMVAPEPKADIKEEIQREKAKEEQKKFKKIGFFKNLRRYFRGKAP